MKALNKARDDILNGNIEILKNRFPHVIQYLDQSPTGDPLTALIREDHGRQPTIHIRRADGDLSQ